MPVIFFIIGIVITTLFPSKFKVVDERRGLAQITYEVVVPTGTSLQEMQEWGDWKKERETKDKNLVVIFFEGYKSENNFVAFYGEGHIEDEKQAETPP